MENIRNFVIIAHIDHGKSTLADRLLELTGTVNKDKMRPQFLDMMDLEREKGITIKLQPVRMEYVLKNPKSKILISKQIPNSKFKNNFEFRASNFEFSDSEFILNLIDTPGHVDFSYEVSRSLAAVEGAILLVDATQGIQAQTISNLEFAKSQNLAIIPAVNKIDMPAAMVKETKEELSSLLDVPVEDIFEISAKQGLNVKELLDAVIKKVPSPPEREAFGGEKPLRALIFDSKFDSFKGVVAFVRVVEGKISSGEKIYLIQNKAEGQAKEVGYFKPQLEPASELKAGEIGYIATGIKEPEKVRVGDTITKFQIPNSKIQVEALHGYKEPQPMVFASIYPENADDFELFRIALAKLKLSDAALEYEPEIKEGLGRGYRCGFLGTLHAEIISERLHREFGLDLIISTPSVVYKITNQRNKEIFIYSATEWPSQTEIKEMQEPWVKLEIITPLNYLGPVSEIIKNLEGNYLKTDYVGKERLRLVYEVPLRKIIVGFYDNLKSQSQGFCSMSYEILGYMPADLVKVDILVAGKKEEVFSKVVAQKDSFAEGQKIVSKLKEVLPQQLFSVPLQAAIGGKIIARETIKAKRRDVIAPLYGGDYTRKKKLLEKQKKGKKKLASRGQLRIPAKSYLEIFKSL